MDESLGISHEGIKVALDVKKRYKRREPICVPGDNARILLPENLLNADVDLHGFEDPLPLAMVATRDPESPMALAATARLTPLARDAELVSGVVQVVGESTKHPLVRRCVELVTENAFSPKVLSSLRFHASRMVGESRARYTRALRQNLHAMMEGTIPPREFVQEFFELTEAGNLRNDIRKKLVLSLLLSEAIRPSVKFLVLENFRRLPQPVRLSIIAGVLKAEPTRHTEIIKEELKWIVSPERHRRDVH